MAQVFISYARENKDFAEALARVFEEKGFNVWWDEHIPGGDDFRSRLNSQLSNADCIVVCWSKAAVQSRWVVDEAEDGAARGILVPVLCQDAEIPRGFRGFQTIDLTEWDGETNDKNIQSLLQVVESKLTNTEKKQPVVFSARSAYELSLRRKALRNTALIGFAIAAIIAFAGWDFLEGDGGLQQNRMRLAAVGLLSLLAVSTWLVRKDPAASWLMCFSLITICIVSILLNHTFSNPKFGIDKYPTPLNLAALLTWGIGVGAINVWASMFCVGAVLTAYVVLLFLLSTPDIVFVVSSTMNLVALGIGLCVAKRG